MDLVLLEVNENVFVPVLNDGVEDRVGSGRNNDPIIVPELSALSLICFIFATAPLDCPTKDISFVT